MGCQKKIAKEIIEADADYVLALKGNQETVRAEVKTFLDDTLAQKDLATPRRLALNMLKSEKRKKRGKQLNASWDHAYLLRLLNI